MTNSRTLTEKLRPYLVSMALVAVALPIAVLSIARGVDWLDKPFPGFFAGASAVVPSVSGVDWPRDKTALFHAQVLSVDGQPVRSGSEIYALVREKPVGTKFRYEFRKGQETFGKNIRSRAWTLGDYLQTWAITSGFGIITILVGLLVASLQPTSHQARVFQLMAFTGGIYALTGVFLHQADSVWLSALCLSMESLFPATFIHLAMVFPVDRYPGTHRQRRYALPYIPSLLLIGFGLAGYFSDPPNLTPLRLTYIYTAASIFLFIAFMVWAWLENAERMVRARIAALLPGLVLGTTAMLFAFLNNAIAGGNIPIQLPLVATLIFYGSVGYSITRHELFGIDRVIRQSFVYGLMSTIILGGYALAILLPARLLPATIAGRQEITAGVFVLLLAFLFDPLRRGVQITIDRAFFRSSIDDRQTISSLSEELTTMLDRQEIVEGVASLATRTLELESAGLFLGNHEGGTLWKMRAEEDTLNCEEGSPDMGAACDYLAKGISSFDTERLIPAVREKAPKAADALAKLEARLAFPLVVRGESIGVLALGPKRSGREISSEEILLLRTLSHQAAIALQNARSYEELELLNRDLDLKVQERTTQLAGAYDELKQAQAQLVQSEKLSSLGEFVAGIAHELNNPASFVRGSLQILTEFLEVLREVFTVYKEIPITDETLQQRLTNASSGRNLEDVLRETPELLRICNEGAERIERTVSELKIFIRKDRGDRAPTSVIESLSSALRMLEPRIREQNVVLETNFGEVPEIEADSAALGQVWINLITNALDAVRGLPEPRIRLSVKPLDNGQIEISIDDNGPGIAPEVADKIFEPFVTTKDIGEGTGLGLSIAYGVIRSHAGELEATDAPEGGATFRVRLPR
jgi:signal transduction histidine kinase